MEAEIDQEREEIEQMYEEERAEEQEKMREVGMARIRREACRRAFAAFRDAVEAKEWEENVEWEPLFVRRVEWSERMGEAAIRSRVTVRGDTRTRPDTDGVAHQVPV